MLKTKPTFGEDGPDFPTNPGLELSDDCLRQGGTSTPGLWSIVDGPPACITTNPARPEGDDTILQFTGSAWSKDSALCRAKDAFFGATSIGNVPTIQEQFVTPADAIGYCIVNEGTDGEVIMFSTCGIQSAAAAACEETLPSSADLTARWESCPGGPLCVPALDDVCFDMAGDGRSYSMFLDNPDLTCPDDSGLSDSQDTLMFTLGSGYNQSMAICVGTSAYDAAGGLSFGVSAVVRREDDGDPLTVPMPREGKNDYDPAGAKGYCLFYAGTPKEVAFFSMCDQIAATDQGLKGELTPAQACEMQSSAFIGAPRPGVWYDCPGSPLCID